MGVSILRLSQLIYVRPKADFLLIFFYVDHIASPLQYISDWSSDKRDKRLLNGLSKIKKLYFKYFMKFIKKQYIISKIYFSFSHNEIDHLFQSCKKST